LLLQSERPSEHHQKQPIQPFPCLTGLELELLELLELLLLLVLLELLELLSLRLLLSQKLLLLNL
jgi:hypothetical protein